MVSTAPFLRLSNKTSWSPQNKGLLQMFSNLNQVIFFSIIPQWWSCLHSVVMKLNSAFITTKWEIFGTCRLVYPYLCSFKASIDAWIFHGWWEKELWWELRVVSLTWVFLYRHRSLGCQGYWCLLLESNKSCMMWIKKYWAEMVRWSELALNILEQRKSLASNL